MVAPFSLKSSSEPKMGYIFGPGISEYGRGDLECSAEGPVLAELEPVIGHVDEVEYAV